MSKYLFFFEYGKLASTFKFDKKTKGLSMNEIIFNEYSKQPFRVKEKITTLRLSICLQLVLYKIIQGLQNYCKPFKINTQSNIINKKSLNTSKIILVVIGTRPEAIKLAPLIKLLSIHFKVFCICTGQHSLSVIEILDLFQIKPTIINTHKKFKDINTQLNNYQNLLIFKLIYSNLT
ncbi:MAG: hypothetical protein IPO94_18105 [Saprospiraceae bacterium]|nr:hypothetical protein [Saprospiraceae bacterium]